MQSFGHEKGLCDGYGQKNHDFDTVAVSGGRIGSTIVIAPGDLLLVTQAKLAEIAV